MPKEAAMNWTIADHGDDVEKCAWGAFLSSELPSYETFWAREIVRLTNRPANIYLKTDDEIARLSPPPTNIPEAVCIAQLHHSVMRHLLFVLEVRKEGVADIDDFTNAVIRLVSAQDVAFELLGRKMMPGQFGVSKASECRMARDAWIAAANNDPSRASFSGSRKTAWAAAVRNDPSIVQFDCRPMERLRNYRHRLVHGRIPPWWKQDGQPPLVPSLSAINDYIDWRRADDPKTASTNPDFKSAADVLEEARSETVAYLEKAWKFYLLK
jgi:hypothetical protein